MRTKRGGTIAAAGKAFGVGMILSSEVVVSPFLVWITLAANVPLIIVILLLIGMAVISNCLTNIAIGICTLDKHSSRDEPHGAPKRQPAERNHDSTQASARR
jgi:hypothetical protein